MNVQHDSNPHFETIHKGWKNKVWRCSDIKIEKKNKTGDQKIVNLVKNEEVTNQEESSIFGIFYLGVIVRTCVRTNCPGM